MFKSEIKENDIFLTSSSIIDEICRPLRKIGINYLTYLKNYQDGSQINLSNSARWIEHYYQFKLYASSLFEASPASYKSGYILWPSESKLKVFNHGRKYFDSDKGVTLIQKAEDYTEFFFFSGSSKNKALNNVHINNLDILENFTAFFKDKLENIIKQADKSRIIIPKHCCEVNPEEAEILNLYEDEATELRQLFAKNASQKGEESNFNRETIALLSSREEEIIQCLLNGKTAKETARELQISHRTVERHLENIKIKLDCRTKFELVNKILAKEDFA